MRELVLVKRLDKTKERHNDAHRKNEKDYKNYKILRALTVVVVFVCVFMMSIYLCK